MKGVMKCGHHTLQSGAIRAEKNRKLSSQEKNWRACYDAFEDTEKA
jgi:hypothetical protein